METQAPTLYHCRKCGKESAIKEAYTSVRVKWNNVEEFVCFECATKQQARSLFSSFLMLFILGLVLNIFTSTSWLGKFYLYLSLGLVLSIPLVVLHEVAHLLVARIVGLRVFAIHLGTGKIIYSVRFLGLRWVLRQIPISGVTIVAGPLIPRYRLRKFLTYLAGPGLHLVLLFISLGLLSGQLFAPVTNLIQTLAQAGFWINLLMLVGNLYPHKIATSAGVAGTDGWAMLHVFRLSPAELEAQQAIYFVLEANEAIEQGQKEAARPWVEKGQELYPNNPLIVNLAGFVYSHLAEYQRARSAFLQTLESDPPPSAGLKYLAMNNIAFVDLMLEDPALLPEADAYSEQAYQNFSWEPLIVGTRGAVLVTLGKPDEGIELLKKAMAGSFDPTSKAMDACLIVRGEIQRGNNAEAKKYLEAARQLDPNCLLLERVTGEFNQFFSGNAAPEKG
jgi:tetratricopeptide (TPR) repeat protein